MLIFQAATLAIVLTSSDTTVHRATLAPDLLTKPPAVTIPDYFLELGTTSGICC